MAVLVNHPGTHAARRYENSLIIKAVLNLFLPETVPCRSLMAPTAKDRHFIADQYAELCFT